MCVPEFDPYSDPLFRSRLTPEELASLDDNPYNIHNLLEQAKIVFFISWNTRCFGFGGAEWVKEFRGIYVWFSTDFDPRGPFESMDQALANGFIDAFCDNHSVESDAMSPDELRRYVHKRFDSGSCETIVINNEPYRWTEAGFVLCDWAEIQ